MPVRPQRPEPERCPARLRRAASDIPMVARRRERDPVHVES